MLAPESNLLRAGRPVPRFDPRPYRAAAASLRPAQTRVASEPLAWGAVLVFVPMAWIFTIVWAVDRLF